MTPSPRMQPPGRTGARLRAGGKLLERAKERRFVRAQHRGLQLTRKSLGGLPLRRIICAATNSSPGHSSLFLLLSN
jgi:hypothetical protein